MPKRKTSPEPQRKTVARAALAQEATAKAPRKATPARRAKPAAAKAKTTAAAKPVRTTGKSTSPKVGPAAARKAAAPKAKSSASKRSAAKKSTPKRIGSPDSRRIVKNATLRVLAACKDQPASAAAKFLGVARSDVHNMRSGNQITVPILVKMIQVGRFDPASVLNGPTLRKLPPKRDVRGAQVDAIAARIHKLAWTRSGVEWARLTGLSLVGAYGLRYPKTPRVRLGTVVTFLLAGHTIEELFYGE